MLSKEKHAPIDRFVLTLSSGLSICQAKVADYRTKLSKTLMSDASKLEWRTPADLRIKYGTILRVGVVSTASF